MNCCTLGFVRSLDRLLQNLTKISADFLLGLLHLKNHLLVHHCFQMCAGGTYKHPKDDFTKDIVIGLRKAGELERCQGDQTDFNKPGSTHSPTRGGASASYFCSYFQHAQGILDVPMSTKTITRRLIISRLHS
ncbi:hypothetical protein TNCV_3309861 [Trichonephila clavipes]|nr:hypothetical protein TNCV_3309861 [Trichonephila clavipes]